MYPNREDVKTFRIAASLSVRQVRKLRATADRLGVSPTTALTALAFEHPLLRDDAPPMEQQIARDRAA